MSAARPEHPPLTPLEQVVALSGAAGAAGVPGDPDLTAGIAVTGLTLDSREVHPGDLYVAAPGSATHGARFASSAVRAGARAVLTDPAGAQLCAAGAGIGVPVLVVPAPRAVLGRLSAALYGDPAQSLALLGVTGTQGKTTTTWLAEGALLGAGISAGVIGTVGTRVAGAEVSSALTTPEAPELHALLAVMRERRVAACAAEVSSHAVVMGRVDGVVWDLAAFTNLGRDHLDFHGDMESYYAAKAQLFTPQRSRRGLVNLDDPHGRRLVREAGVPVLTYATSASSDAGSEAGADADWRAVDVVCTAGGSRFTVVGPVGEQPVELRVPGDFNVSNAVCAIAGLVELGFELHRVAAGIGSVLGVPGRLESVDAGQEFLAVVDYAHKPDAVRAVLGSLRGRTRGRLLVVLGAGGDRDRGKRPLMGEVAGALADVVVVTDDNPRTEDPAAIRGELLSGARAGGAVLHDIGDRGAAIRHAVEAARAGDTVVVLGKGHETGQEVAGELHPFDDRVELRRALQERR